jgi:hypothetical protein
MYHALRNQFGHTWLYTYVMWVKLKLISVHLEIVLISAQDSCSDWDEHTLARNSFCVYPMELLSNMGEMEARFGLFGDSVNLVGR